MLTGKMQTQAMRIYAVSHSGRLSDVTSQTTCHSGDEDALKVPYVKLLSCTGPPAPLDRLLEIVMYSEMSVKISVETRTQT